MLRIRANSREFGGVRASSGQKSSPTQYRVRFQQHSFAHTRPYFLMDKTSALLLSDREIASVESARREDAARDALAVVGSTLEGASTAIDALERDNLLGPAIIRCCNELADAARDVAREIGRRDEGERRELARACLSDVSNAHRDLILSVEGCASDSSGNGGGQPKGDSNEVATRSAAEAMAALSEEDIMYAVDASEAILIDVEEALRSVGTYDAEEIADVGLTVARMFIWSLQSVHGVMESQQLLGTHEGIMVSDNFIVEIIDDGDKNGGEAGTSASSGRPREGLPTGQRFRLLWPPLGPAVASAGKWGADAASNTPVLSVALAMALWPGAVAGAFLGVPILAADWVLQRGYNAAKNGPVIEAAERGVANLYQVGKLSFLCGKLVLRQGLRVGQKQVERKGGLGAVAEDVGRVAVDRAMHPVETVTRTWEGIKWGAGTLWGAGAFMKEVAMGDITISGVPPDMH